MAVCRSIIQTDRGNQIDGAALGAMLRGLGNISLSRRSDDFHLLPDAQPAEYLEVCYLLHLLCIFPCRSVTHSNCITSLLKYAYAFPCYATPSAQ